MKPILYSAGETEFKSNGLGRLADAVSYKVVEERNGQYELELEYPVTGLHYADIMEERIICARHDDTDDIQPFRIYKITRPMQGIVTVNASTSPTSSPRLWRCPLPPATVRMPCKA